MWARYGFKFRGATLSREITVVLAVKAVLLLMLWLAFFSAAPAPNPGDVTASVLGAGKLKP